MIQSSLLSPFSTTNTKTLTFITYIHHNRSSPFYDALDWSWESIPTIVHRLWAGWRRVSVAGRGKVLIVPLLHNIQNISWVSPNHMINEYSGLFIFDQGTEV